MIYSQYDPAAQSRVPWNFGAKIGSIADTSENLRYPEKRVEFYPLQKTASQG